MEEKYFVVSNGDKPDAIFFNREVVFGMKTNQYIDSFDVTGTKVESYKLVDGEYTTDF